ncbi:helix-turn-helix domain-containing protein [Halococcus saccharolyticus]|uniref:Bacterio-opsin activator HTH domain-containing protein n=1 Tax=Halococcus saccharolyticus DSM 5350 TaxID=1227455 RepID=M0MJZ6_9EURY|nr:helix-turn-helix domain-containing protein [Halococcus saccharolyticus]EMA44780.1 bacterio-opsin activator HTH domain-containing protein [Halococcus saccharolyticus DSM 5350]
MTTIAGLAIPSDEFSLGEVLSHPSARIELTQFVPIGNHLLPYFWVGAGYDAAAFERQVRSDPHVASLTDLDGSVTKTLYHIEWTDDAELDGLLGVFRDNDILVEEAEGTATEWRFQIRAHNTGVLEAFQRECLDRDIPIEITQVYHNPTETEIDSYGLTPKQYEALALAFEQGYFTVPRESSLTELAEEVGISRQAYSRRLQRGLRGILAETFQLDE